MNQTTKTFAVATDGPALTDITPRVADWLAGTGAGRGLLTLFCRHTSASLTIQENCDPKVLSDLVGAMDRIAPRDAALYGHAEEGPDDMPGHVKTALSGVQLSIPVIDGRMTLGTWQALYLWEHRDRPREREVAAHLLYE